MMEDDLRRKETFPFYERYHASSGSDYYRTVQEPTLNKRIVLFSEVISDRDCILDFGCGSGTIIGNISKIRSLDPDSIGVDISEIAIIRAKESFPHIKFKTINSSLLSDFPSDFFDTLVSSEVIEHVIDTETIFNEFYRVLRPNGKLALTCPYHGLIKDIAILLAGRFETHFHDPYSPHVRYYSLKSLKKVFHRHGFDFLWCAGVGRAPYLWKSIFVLARKPEK